MGTATVELSGSDAARWAADLHAALAAKAQPGDSVSPVEVQRSAESVIALIGLVFSGVGAAKTIWDWWHSRGREAITVKVLLPDGTQVDVSSAGLEHLEVVFRQGESQ